MSMPGASNFTPMTSVSSLKANHSSRASNVAREIAHAEERSNGYDDKGFDTNGTGSWREEQVVHESSAGLSQRPLSGVSSSKGLFEGSGSGYNTLPTPKASVSGSLGPTAVFEEPQRVSTVASNLQETNQQRQSTKQSSSSLVQKPIISGPKSSPPCIPDSQSSKVTRPISSSQNFSLGLPESKGISQAEVVSPSQASSSKTTTLNPSKVQESFFRNTIDPTYEFSDEEIGIESKMKEPPLKLSMSTPSSSDPTLQTQSTVPSISDKMVQATAKPSTPPLPSKVRPTIAKPSAVFSDDAQPRKTQIPQLHAILPAVTPITKRKPPRTIPSRMFDVDDLDELSLGLDGFVSISSQLKTNPRPGTLVRVKHEAALDGPRTAPVASTKKRKLSMFQGNDEEDELVMGTFSSSRLGPSSVSYSRVKMEADENSLPLSNTTASKLKDTRPGPSAAQLMTRAENNRKNKSNSMSTPLLDLPPSRRAIANPNGTGEIADSEEPSSPKLPKTESEGEGNAARDQKEVVGTDSLTDLLTPVRKQRWARDPLQGEKVTIVMKTPGGTLRRCGEDAFSCGRSFCFRCSSKEGTKND
jgi:hypothetical protein